LILLVWVTSQDEKLISNGYKGKRGGDEEEVVGSEKLTFAR
jgi:hypothetical protein